jgi:hypothetical protein
VIAEDTSARSSLRDVPGDLVLVGVHIALGIAVQSLWDTGGGAWSGLGLAVGSAISGTTVAALERRGACRVDVRRACRVHGE